MTTTPRLGITQLEEGQALPEVVVNEADVILEMLATRLIVLSKGDAAPAGGEVDGDAYLVGSTGTGDFAGFDDLFALRINGAWRPVTPLEGMEIEVLDEDTSYTLRGGTWVEATSALALDDISDVNAPSPANGEVLTWDSTPGEWVAQALPGAGAFVLDDATDVNAPTPANGEVLTWDSTPGEWVAQAPSGAGWTLASTNTIGGSVASVDFTGLAGATDIMIICRNVTQASSGVIVCRVSVNNGSSYYAASGDYITLTAAGVESNTTFGAGFHQTSATAARSGIVYLFGAGVNGGIKGITSALSATDTRLFVASTSPIDAVRVLGSAGNLTGGTIYVFTR